MEISQKFLDKYNLLYGTLFNNYLRVTEKSNLRSAQKELGALAFQGYASACPEEAAKYDARNLPETVEDNAFKIQLFLVLAGLNSYYGLCNLDHLARKEGEDAHFGYAGAFDTLKGYCVLHSKNNKEFTDATLSRLESTLRSCSFSEYVEKGHYEKDIDWVSNLMQNLTANGVSDEDGAAVEVAFATDVLGALEQILVAYNEILSAAFGLDKYVGVFTFDKARPVVGLTPSFTVKSYEPVRQFTDSYAKVLRDTVLAVYPRDGVHCQDGSIYWYSDRQFDFRAILEGYRTNSSLPIYFPAKILEIISLARWTTTTTANVYGDCLNGENKNLSTYTNYLKTQFKRNIHDFCVYLCKVYIQQAISAGNKELENLSLQDILFDDDSPYRTELHDNFVQPILAYYVKCVTTAVVIAELTTEKVRGDYGGTLHNILSFRIRVFAANALQSNDWFCKQLSMKLYGNQGQMSDIEETPVHPCRHGYIADYTYTFDADKVYARPIFAYKALDAMRAQGRELSWKNILLGKYTDGSLCTSGSESKISLQSSTLHSIYAGSRSGKGVMCFNIFATAIASGLPLFYLDRKPDTAVIMRKLCPNMFAVNGGQYDKGKDLEHVFDPAKMNSKIPKYLEGYIESKEVACDYAYFRAFMLFWCLIIFAEKRKDTDTRAAKMCEVLNGGAVLVLDEFTNFTNAFLKKKPVAGGSGWFSFNNCYGSNAFSDFATSLAKIVAAAKKGESSKDVATKELASKTASSKVSSLKSSFKLHALYFAEVSEMYEQVLYYIDELNNAGGSFIKSIQMFVIGQDIPAEYYDSPLTFRPSSSKAKYNTSKHKAGNVEYMDVPLLGLLKRLSGDYILGYQPENKGGHPEYLAQHVKGTISSQLVTASRRCFCYYNPHGTTGYKELQQLTNTRACFGSVEAINEFLGKMVFFKPFLILNNANEPPESVRQPDSIPVSEELANTRAGVGDKGKECLSSQYVGQCLTSCNNAGLTWDDLLADNDDGTGHLRNEIGFEGYIRGLCGTVPTNKLAASGDLMNMLVQEVIGYNGTWQDYIFDFTPEALFTPSTIFDAADHPEHTVRDRLSATYFHSDLLNTSSFGKYSFAEIYKEELGSLYPYYGAEGSSNVSRDKSVSTKPADVMGGVSFVNEGTPQDAPIAPTEDDFAAQAAKMSQNMGSSSENNASEGSEEITFDFIFDNISKSLAIVKQHPKYAGLLKRKGGEQRVAYALATIIATKMGISH